MRRVGSAGGLSPEDRLIRTDYFYSLAVAVAAKAPALVAAMILTRAFAPEVMGGFFVSTAIAALVLLFTTFGTHIHLVRAVARDPERGLIRLGEVIQLRVPLTALALFALAGGSAIFAPDLMPVMTLAAVYVLCGDFANSFGAYIAGRRRFRQRFFVSLAGPVALLLSVPFVVQAGATLEETLLCYIGASLFAVLVAGLFVRLRYGPIPITLDLGRLRSVVLACWPFVVLEALQVVQFKIDTLMVFWILTPEAAAHYETAYRLLEVSRLAVRPLAVITFPVLAALIAQHEWAAARDRGMKTALLAAAIGVGVTSVVMINPEWIIVTVWGPAYAGQGGLLRVLFFSAPLVYVGLLGVTMANAMGRERRLILIMACATVFNVSMNSLAIPWLGPIGAAWTTLATEVAIVAGLLHTLRSAMRQVL
jgi:O-antigen/teichoic acid export membrane protein